MQNMFGELNAVEFAAKKVDELEIQCRRDLEELIGDKMPLDVVSEKEIEWFVKRGDFSREKADKALDLWSKIKGLMKVHGQLIQADNALCMMGF